MSNSDKLSRGTILGRYELLLPIAQGGMATVWAARQKGSRGFQKTVAVKTMLPQLSDDPQFEQMFLDEASLAARIHHPNVAEILDLGEQDDVLYIVMEWVDGEALSVVTKTAKRNKTAVPMRIALRMLTQACAGLHAAHELRDDNEQPLELVHRDVSPQNILVTYDGVVKLVDFGVAKAAQRMSAETTAGQLKGKVPYMSPEQARGAKVDRRTDIFAMGIVLYKLTTGLHPFLGENDIVTMKNIVARPALSPRVRNPEYPPELERVLLKCLHKDPDKRYENMQELERALERVLLAMNAGGGGQADDDVGGFVRSLMGDLGQKRRAGIRDAIRSADERDTGAAPAPTGPIQHEGISEIALTALASGVSEEMLPDRPSLYNGSSLLTSGSGSLSALSANEQNVAITADITRARARRRALFAGAGALALVTALGVVALLSRVAPAPSPAEPPPPQTTKVEPPPAIPAPVVEAPVEPKAVDLNDLPTTPTAEPVAAPVGPVQRTVPRTEPVATPSGSTTPAGRPVPRPWVPSVTDPGF